MTLTPPPSSAPGARLSSLAFWRDLSIVLAVVTAGLVYGAGLLIPFSLALLIFVLLVAVVDWVADTRFGGQLIPRWAAHIASLFLILGGMAVIVAILNNQANAISAQVPAYTDKAHSLIAAIVAMVGEENAIAVEEALAGADYSNFAVAALEEAGIILSGFFLVLLYIPFLMVERAPMAHKLRLAAGDTRFGNEVASVFEEISEGLKKYIGVKTFVSLLTGVFSYAVMKPMGLEFAETWALLAFALNFIPSIGSILGVVMPSLVALVQFDTIVPFLIIAVGCGIVQVFIGNVLEPALTGLSLNLSPLMVILALTVWTTLWGIPGAFLSVPITVCLLIVFSHLPATRPVAILMSGDGHLPGSGPSAADPTPNTGPRTDGHKG